MEKENADDEECVPYSENEFQEFLRILEICDDGSQNQLLDVQKFDS